MFSLVGFSQRSHFLMTENLKKQDDLVFYELIIKAQPRRLTMTPEIAQRIFFHLRWYYESMESKSPNSEILERVTKEQFDQILKDETQMSEETIGGFMTALEMQVSENGIEAVTDTKIKKLLGSFESNYSKHY